ncbi:MAG: conjugative transposon protein TraM [Ginsengibacter sp.]
MKNLNFAQKRKLLVMPLLILPFITFAFWALGGGKDASRNSISPTGLNLELPEAQPRKERNDSKLSFYEEAARDSAAMRESMKKDPYFQSIAEDGNDVFETDTSFDEEDGTFKDEDVNEEKVYAKIRELNRHLKDRGSMQTAPVVLTPESQVENEARTMEQLNQDNKDGKDSEIIALNGLMDKIIAIQHPDQFQGKEEKGDSENEKNIFKVTSYELGGDQSYFGSINQCKGHTTFYGLVDTLNDRKGNLIPAEVDQDQELYSGTILKMRLLQDLFVGNEKVPKGSFIYGGVSIGRDRLKVDISSIRLGHSIFPVHISVYDFDGMPGINIPGGDKRSSIKEASQTGLQGLDLASLDPSIKAQATTAGIHAVKSLINENRKQKVFVKDGYRIFLNVKN